MSPVQAPYPSYQIFDSYNPKFQFYRFPISESRNIRDKEGKLLTEVIIFSTDEETAIKKCDEYITTWKDT